MVEPGMGVGRRTAQPMTRAQTGPGDRPQSQPASRRRVAHAVRLLIGAMAMAAIWTVLSSGGAGAADTTSGRTLGGLTRSVSHATQPVLRVLGGSATATTDAAQHTLAPSALG
jgi:hypothetical protein